MNLADFHDLQTPLGVAALSRAVAMAPDDATLLTCATRLRREFPASLAAAALETVLLRPKAAAKFAQANGMFFTREALEQSSSEIVSRYRAERFASCDSVGDFCCGIGGDTIAVAEQHAVCAIDADPLRLAMAVANLRVYGHSERVSFIGGDLLTIDLPVCDGYFFDPDRRIDGKRQVSLIRCEPPLDSIRHRLQRDCPLGVKVAPGVPRHEIDALDAEAEFISVDGELKECVLWFGPMRTTLRRATLLPDRQTLFGEPTTPAEICVPQGYLYDPDAAIVRAGLVANLADVLSAKLIDPEIAYLTSNELRATSFATAYRIDEFHPFNLKKLTERLRALGVGRITVVKRGSAVDADLLMRRCKLEGSEHRVVILTRAAGNPCMMIGERISP